MNRSAFLRLLALCLLSTWSSPAAEAPRASANVLFIGNSYTAPVVPVFREFAKAKGKTGRIEAVIANGAQLRKHVEKGDAARLIAEGGWHAVCLQEQSQTPSFPEAQVREETDPAVRALREAAKGKADALVMYEHWARRDGDRRNRADDTHAAQAARLQYSFDRLAREHKLRPAPVGRAWDRVMKDHPEINLYQPDGSHPSPAGAYLAACVLYATIYGESPEGLPATKGVEAAAAKAIQSAVKEVRLASVPGSGRKAR